MIFNKQLFFHKPELGEYGDCDRTAIACLLNKQPDELPNWGVYYSDFEQFDKVRQDYVNSQGFIYIDICWAFPTVEEILEFTRHRFKDLMFILGGVSKNGTGHSVIACNGEIIWDPAKDDSGIVSPYDDGTFQTGFLISKQFTIGK